MLDSRRWTLDAGLWTLDFGRWTLDARCWMLDSGYWTLDSGRFKDHGHACFVKTIGSDMDIFRNSILTLSVTL